MNKCPHAVDCPMYALFNYAGTLAVWQVNYCASDFERCARFQRSAEGREVPINLLPNGQMLNKAAAPATVKAGAGAEE